LFPNNTGELINFFLNNGINCSNIHIPYAVPDFANYLIHASQLDFHEIANNLKEKNFELVISNTISSPHGAIIANDLNIPHITYVHEHIEGDADLSAFCISNDYYMNMIESQSDHVLCCSKFVKRSLNRKTPSTILYPHNFSFKLIEKNYFDPEKAFNILVIGVKSVRKNTHFSLSVLKALRLRGLKVHLHIIGHESTGSSKLNTQIIGKAEENVFIHPQLKNPYELLALGNCITLVCSQVEAFGLTITESLQRSIPVISSKSGGPEELLGNEYLFDVDNINQCVKSIEKVIKNYTSEINLAEKNYLKLEENNSLEIRKNTIELTIQSALKNFKKNKNFLIRSTDLALSDIATNIDRVILSETGIQLNSENLIHIEKIHPGLSVQKDIMQFDVVPFSASAQMDCLYREGFGLAIELASTFDDISRIKMAVVILGKLLEISNNPSELEILSIGDGLGVDAIRLAACGFPIDYIDYDRSNMAKIAELNFDSYKIKNEDIDIRVLNKYQKSYDAVVCLEVIEHVEDVFNFIEVLKDAVSPNGYLFISECFDGIRDRWPTHLYDNEKYSNLLPLMLAPYFNLIDLNKDPYSKPYIFQRKSTSSTTPKELFEIINEKWVSLGIVSAKNSIGI
jgi:2-polyprenyl-3-methyl-5-hydroxy-6-metoxy-1,4-benzoquinol methylase/glycosyltransferase involved in cell wall biosynthesis